MILNYLTFFYQNHILGSQGAPMNNAVEISTTWLNLEPGDIVKVTKLNPGPGHYRMKLLSLGLIPGTIFQVIRIAPLGDPIEIRLRGFALTLRKQEAQLIEIKRT